MRIQSVEFTMKLNNSRHIEIVFLPFSCFTYYFLMPKQLKRTVLGASEEIGLQTRLMDIGQSTKYTVTVVTTTLPLRVCTILRKNEITALMISYS